jgi:hypothetical protein
MPMAGGAVEPHHRPIDVGQGIGAFRHDHMLRAAGRPDMAGEIGANTEPYRSLREPVPVPEVQAPTAEANVD